MQQIAGRAGRGETDGTVTALDYESLRHVADCMGVEAEPVERAGVSPSLEALVLHSGGDVPDDAPLYELVRNFVEDASHEPHFFLCDLSDMLAVARVVDRFRTQLSLVDRFHYAMAPFDTDCEVEMAYLYAFAKHHALERRVPLGIRINSTAHQRGGRDALTKDHMSRLLRLEALYGAIDAYVWLSYRFGVTVYPERHLAQITRDQCVCRVRASARTYPHRRCSLQRLSSCWPSQR